MAIGPLKAHSCAVGVKPNITFNLSQHSHGVKVLDHSNLVIHFSHFLHTTPLPYCAYDSKEVAMNSQTSHTCVRAFDLSEIS